MRRLVETKSTRPVETLAVNRDYAAFERLRTTRRQYTKAFGGMAMLVLLGAAFDRVPRHEALIVAGWLSLGPLGLFIVERVRWRRLVRRLDVARAAARAQKDVSV